MSDTMQCPVTGDTLVRAKGARPDWKMPEPLLCTHYVFDTTTDEVDEKVPMKPAAHCEDGWELFWWCPKCEFVSGDGGDIDWPFLPTEFAEREDLEAVGFEVFP